MNKVVILIWAFILCVFQSRAFCTPPHPTPGQEVNLVEKFNLNQTDKIVIRKYCPVGSAPDLDCAAINVIKDKNDIKKILSGFTKIREIERRSTPPEWELLFYSAGKEIMLIGLYDFQYDFIYVIGSNQYMYGGEADQVVLNYMSSNFNKERDKFLE
jgi:hypothetical protein